MLSKKPNSQSRWTSIHWTTSLTQSPKGILGTGDHLLRRLVLDGIGGRSACFHGLRRLAEHGQQPLARHDTDKFARVVHDGDGYLARRARREELEDRSVLVDLRRGVDHRVALR